MCCSRAILIAILLCLQSFLLGLHLGTEWGEPADASLSMVECAASFDPHHGSCSSRIAGGQCDMRQSGCRAGEIAKLTPCGASDLADHQPGPNVDSGSTVAVIFRTQLYLTDFKKEFLCNLTTQLERLEPGTGGAAYSSKPPTTRPRPDSDANVARRCRYDIYVLYDNFKAHPVLDIQPWKDWIADPKLSPQRAAELGLSCSSARPIVGFVETSTERLLEWFSDTPSMRKRVDKDLLGWGWHEPSILYFQVCNSVLLCVVS